MKLIAISGGVDSMVLANKYKNKNVILAFVNYNLRNDTKIDQKIVEGFALKNNLKLEKLILTKDQIPSNENFENWAREIRYNFFKKIYKKYNCNELLVAHHKDDFLETCLMQKKKNNEKLFYGIKKIKYLYGMKINRPFLFKYWKDEIYQIAHKEKIDYNEDYTNQNNDYERNKVRNEILKKMSINQKKLLLNKFIEINNKNKMIIKEIKEEYKNWKKNKFSILFFNKLNFKDEVIKTFINKRTKNINLNKNILNNLITFLKKNENKKFLLSNKTFIVKKNGKIFLF